MFQSVRSKLRRLSSGPPADGHLDTAPVDLVSQPEERSVGDSHADNFSSSQLASTASATTPAAAGAGPAQQCECSAPTARWNQQIAAWTQPSDVGGRTRPFSRAGELERFSMVKELGRGGTSVVMLAVDSLTQQQVAVKRIPFAPGFKRDTITRELVNHSMCSGHPHIIQLQEVYLAREQLCVVMELAEGGDLAQRMEELHHYGVHAMPEEEARWIFQQLLVAVDYCQRLGVANRDIKLDNIMVHGFWPWPTIKMCDFGFSKDEARQSACDTSCGTPEYIAPEILLKETYDGRMADAWSSGVALYALLNGCFPFARAEDSCEHEVVRMQRMFSRILKCQMAPVHGLSAEGMDLLQRLLNPDPASRLSVQQALQHPWVAVDMPPALEDLNDRLLAIKAAAGHWHARGGAAAQGFRAGCCQTPDELRQIVEQANQARLSSGSQTLSSMRFFPPTTEW